MTNARHNSLHLNQVNVHDFIVISCVLNQISLFKSYKFEKCYLISMFHDNYN